MNKSLPKNRKCIKCHAVKLLDEFERARSKKFGRTYRCRPCARRERKEWYARDKTARRVKRKQDAKRIRAERQRHYKKYRQRLLEIARQWRKDNPEKAKAYWDEWIAKNPEKTKRINIERTRRFNRKHPEQVKARMKIVTARRNGSLVKPQSCSKCGNGGRIEGHHYLGYDEKHQLDVEWLCVRCHKDAHK